jgi:hypothetical protein
VSAVQALHAALALARTPQLAHAMRLQPLPPGVTTLLRIVAGEEKPLAAATLATGQSARAVLEAVEHYVQRVMLYPGAPPARVLGIGAGAERAAARAHMRLLMLWLHPDRGASEWRAAFAARVLASWRSYAAGEDQKGVAKMEGFATRGARRGQGHRRPRGLKLPWVAVPLAGRSKARRWRRVTLFVTGTAIVVAALLLPGDLPGNLLSAWFTDGYSSPLSPQALSQSSDQILAPPAASAKP